MLIDVRYVLRMIRRRPLPYVISALLLGCGVGVTTAVLVLMDSLVRRGLPIEDAERLLVLGERSRERSVGVSPANFIDLRERLPTPNAIAAARIHTFNILGASEPLVVEGAQVSSNFFELISIRPITGRSFLPADSEAGAPRVVLVSHGLWERSFGASPDIVGREIALDDEPAIIIGVLPPGVPYPFARSGGPSPGLWSPIREDETFTSRRSKYLSVLTKLPQGLPLSTFTAELDVVWKRLASEYEEDNGDYEITVTGLETHVLGPSLQLLSTVTTASALILLIAVVNVLMIRLGQYAELAGSFSVRRALGAPARALWRLALIDACALAPAATLLALAVSHALRPMVQAVTSIPDLFIDPNALNLQSIVVAFGLSLVTSLIASIYPLRNALRDSLMTSLSTVGRAHTGGRSENRSRWVLSAGQVAFAVIVLYGAGLVVKSFAVVAMRETGLALESVAIVDMSRPSVPRDQRYRLNAFVDELIDRVCGLPFVVDCSISSNVAFEGSLARMPVTTDARRENEVPIEFVLRRVGDSYFKVLGIPLSLGRVFNSTDEYGKARVAVVNKEAARMFWPSRDPVGGRIRIGDPEDGLPWFQVVGVVDDARESYLELPMLPVVYWSYRQSPSQRVVLLARGKGKGSTLAEELKRQVWHVDPQQPVSRVATVEQLYDRQLAGRKMRAIVFVSYAVTAFVLVGLGLYGALSYTVKRRFREVAVRMACGARDRDVVLMFMKMAGGILLAGTVVGCLGAAAFGHVLESLLFEVAWLDGKVMAASIGLVLSWGLIACYPAAAAVTEVQPSAWLRDG